MNIKLLKKSILSLMVLSSSHLFALEGLPKKELLRDIKEQTKKCTVQVVSNPSASEENEKVLGYKSLCSTLIIVSPIEAQVFIEGEWLTANITESAESDGGDLDDLTIINSKGQTIATKTNIAAYDNVLVAMAGDSDFRKIHIQ